jgi:hypothetical protein
MRQWLWKDMLDNVGHYGMPFYVIGCVLGVFAACSLIDFVRIKLIEKPILYWWDRKKDRVSTWISRNEKNFLIRR